MFCPKCNQQQVSETTRFCSRCGFLLAGVALLLQNDGEVPERSVESSQKRGPSRKTIMIESTVFTLVSWMVAIFATFWFDYGGPFETVAKIATVLFFTLSLIGILRFLYGFLFAIDPIDQPNRAVPANLRSRSDRLETPSQFALPAQQSVPAAAYSQRSNTKEMMARPSVTENTTRLLEEQPTDRSE
jgi:hypothetical protein